MCYGDNTLHEQSWLAKWIAPFCINKKYVSYILSRRVVSAVKCFEDGMELQLLHLVFSAFEPLYQENFGYQIVGAGK
jgi:hypothetical protein